MPGAALAIQPLPAPPQTIRGLPQTRPQPRRRHISPFSRSSLWQPKPRQGVKNLNPQIASTPSLKTHENPPEITPVAAEAVVGCSVAAESVPLATRGGTYVLRDAEGVIVRSGRTKDFARRQAEHARDPDLGQYQFDPFHRTDVYAEQRGLEQILHETYKPQLNKIGGVSPTNPKAPIYDQAARDYLLRQGGP